MKTLYLLIALILISCGKAKTPDQSPQLTSTKPEVSTFIWNLEAKKLTDNIRSVCFSDDAGTLLDNAGVLCTPSRKWYTDIHSCVFSEDTRSITCNSYWVTLFTVPRDGKYFCTKTGITLDCKNEANETFSFGLDG